MHGTIHDVVCEPFVHSDVSDEHTQGTLSSSIESELALVVAEPFAADDMEGDDMIVPAARHDIASVSNPPRRQFSHALKLLADSRSADMRKTNKSRR